MRRCLFIGLILLVAGCGSAPKGRRKDTSTAPPNLGRFADLVHLKGALTFSATVKTTARLLDIGPADGPQKGFTLPVKKETMEETVLLSMDPSGNVHGRRDLSSGDGVEFTVERHELCVRLRYQQYLCHPYVPEEAEARIAQLYGTWDGIYSIIAPLAARSAPAPCPGQDMGCSRRSLSIRPEAAPGGTILNEARLTAFSGSIDEDPQGVPVAARLTFTLQGERADHRQVEVTVEYHHDLKRLAGKVPTADPAMITRDWERHRPLMDRKALLGDPIPRTLRHLFRQ